MAPTLRGSVTWSSTMIGPGAPAHAADGRRQRIGQQRDTLVRDVASQQVIQPAAIDAFRLQRPGWRQPGGQRRLGVLGQHQAAQPARRVGERGGDRMQAVQPDRAPGASGVLRGASWSRGRCGPTDDRCGRCAHAGGRCCELATRLNARPAPPVFRPDVTPSWRAPSCRGPSCRGPSCRGPSCRGPSCRGPSCRGPSCRGLWPSRTVCASPMAGTAVARASIPSRALSWRPRRVSTGPAIRTTIGGRARRAAGAVAMRRFHYQAPIALSREPAQPVRSGWMRNRRAMSRPHRNAGVSNACMQPHSGQNWHPDRNGNPHRGEQRAVAVGIPAQHPASHLVDRLVHQIQTSTEIAPMYRAAWLRNMRSPDGRQLISGLI